MKPETSTTKTEVYGEPYTRLGEVVLAVIATLLMVGCNAGPNYKRPTIDVPNQYRGAMAPQIGTDNNGKEESFADRQWVTIFQDDILKHLVQEALANNLDLRVASQRILEAQAQVGVVRSQQFPTVGGGGSYTAIQLPAGLTGNDNNGKPNNSFFNGGGPSASASWNLDFWGLYRRQTEAARAEMLASVWGERATRTTLVETVAESYFRLRSLDAQLEITRNTIQAREDSLHLTQALDKGGAGSLADVRQAEELLHAAEANLPEIRRQIAIQENTLSVLLGHNPGAIDRGQKIDDQPHPEELPVGIPSTILERRPDVQQAEQKLVAANARIGVARAQYFPQISLTSLGGAASNQLNSVFTGPTSYWYAAGSVTEPIFDGGRIRSNYRLSKEQQKEMLLTYQNTILNAFKDVSNALVSYRETREHRERQADQVKSAADAVRLARLRYSGGNTGYLEVLTTDTDLYGAQLQLAQAQEQEASSLVQLYSALGGGWR